MWRILVLHLITAGFVGASGLNLKYPWLSSVLSDKAAKQSNRPMIDTAGNSNYLTNTFTGKFDNDDDMNSLSNQVDAIFGEPSLTTYDSGARSPLNHQQAMKKYWAIMNPGFSWHTKAKKSQPFDWFMSGGEYESYPAGRQFAQLGPVKYQPEEPYYNIGGIQRGNQGGIFADSEN
ncbi:hypothetical protein RvY_06644 [Ramazzottius varieornatus]|uniref:Uncharacterized protein n=1 Tax=Ramazzottius varieornatus TaxID=947166 RepID=A0A1D1V8V4_RAMVA|nr:hypothetical protein RvY_06644 [Ramazzottius varieornatus]